MLEVVSDADTAPSPDASLEIKVHPADSIFGPAPLKDSEKASARKEDHFFGRLLRYIARAAVVAFLCALAWTGGAYYSHSRLPFNLMKSIQTSGTQQDSQRDEVVGAVRQMAEEISALKSSLDSKGVAQVATQPITDPAIANLTGQTNKLEAEFTTKLSQINDRLASIEQQISASHTALASRLPTHHKRVGHTHDAFDPSQDPSAPGAPRALGAQ